MPISRTAWAAVERMLGNRPLEGRSLEGIERLGAIVGGDHPSRHSRSPTLWNRLFAALGLEAFFAAMDLDDGEKLPSLLEAVVSVPGWLDLTVTTPYKSAAYGCLGSLSVPMTVSDRVHHLGCLNHIIVDPAGGRGFVDNTDGQGMFRALEKRRPLRGARVLLAGAGGAAASIAYELVRGGADLAITNIVVEDASRLVERMRPHVSSPGSVEVVDWKDREREAPSCAVVVSAISSSTPLDRDAVAGLPAACLMADTRYGVRAEFVEAARLAGRECVDGREMLCGQFVLAAQTAMPLLGIAPQALASALAQVEEWFLHS